MSSARLAAALLFAGLLLGSLGCGSEDLEAARDRAEQARDDVEKRVQRAGDQFERQRERFGERIREVLGDLEKVFPQAQRTSPTVRSRGRNEPTTIDAYAHALAGLLGPGGRLLNHGIARLRHGEPEAGPFSERYVFPDAAPLHLSRVQSAFERVGFETLGVEGFREDYARTLREWTRRLEANRATAVRLAGAERFRVWQVYLRAARRGFETGFTSVYQVRAVRV